MHPGGKITQRSADHHPVEFRKRIALAAVESPIQLTMSIAAIIFGSAAQAIGIIQGGADD